MDVGPQIDAEPQIPADYSQIVVGKTNDQDAVNQLE